MPGNLLELEITESLFIGFSNEHRKIMQRLRGAGVRFALDDFGMGHSSLDYLRRIAVDRVKIPREFITDLSTSDDAAAIVKCIIDLALGLGSEVIAEGVETAEQLGLLQDMGCSHIQGFHFAAPMTAQAILPHIKAGSMEPANRH
jgi:EAL domain-containing protein (putative c-di-GMP-specific phosphodiesterase class I)